MLIVQHVSNPNQLGKINTDIEQEQNYVTEWDPNVVYKINRVTTYLGSLYKATGTTTAGLNPADTGSEWQLASASSGGSGGGATAKEGTILAGSTEVTITFSSIPIADNNRAVVSGVGANAGQRQIFIKAAPVDNGGNVDVVVGIDSSYTEDIDVHVVLAKE